LQPSRLTMLPLLVLLLLCQSCPLIFACCGPHAMPCHANTSAGKRVCLAVWVTHRVGICAAWALCWGRGSPWLTPSAKHGWCPGNAADTQRGDAAAEGKAEQQHGGSSKQLKAGQAQPCAT
jgi:hypothetical protein